jgi:hypothetical protein
LSAQIPAQVFVLVSHRAEEDRNFGGACRREDAVRLLDDAVEVRAERQVRIGERADDVDDDHGGTLSEADRAAEPALAEERVHLVVGDGHFFSAG